MKKEKINASLLFGIFIYSCCFFLLVTAAAKLISSRGQDKILNAEDPVFHLTFRSLLEVAAAFELGVVITCAFCKKRRIQVSLLAMLGTFFVLYRGGLFWLGYRLDTCPCMGFMTDALHISASTADLVAEIILVYLLVGSYAGLFWLWSQYRSAKRTVAEDEMNLPAAGEKV